VYSRDRVFGIRNRVSEAFSVPLLKNCTNVLSLDTQDTERGELLAVLTAPIGSLIASDFLSVSDRNHSNTPNDE